MRQHFVVPSICRREIARAKRSGVWVCKDALKALDLGDNVLGVHSVPISNMGAAVVKRKPGTWQEKIPFNFYPLAGTNPIAGLTRGPLVHFEAPDARELQKREPYKSRIV